MKNKGITLIALVVTIVVLLILAGVSITAVFGEGGIIALAQEAADKTKEAAENDEKNIKDLANELNSILNGDGTVEDEMTKEEKISMLGSYVDFGLDINNNDTTTDDWRIFYIGGINGDDPEETKDRIYIIAADYIAYENNNNTALKESITNASMKQSTSSGYGNCYYWDTPPAISSYDGFKWVGEGSPPAQTIFPELFIGTGYYCSNHSGNPNAKTVATLQNTSFWDPFIQQSAQKSKADKAMGGPTLEMWIKSWKAMYGDSSPLYFKGENKNSPDENQYGYFLGDTEELSNPMTDTWVYVDIDDKTLYFPHTTSQNLNLDNSGKDDDTCRGYWLASPSNGGNWVTDMDREYLERGRFLVTVTPGDRVTGANYYDDMIGVRTLITLKSGVQLEDSGTTVQDMNGNEVKLYNIK